MADATIRSEIRYCERDIDLVGPDGGAGTLVAASVLPAILEQGAGHAHGRPLAENLGRELRDVAPGLTAEEPLPVTTSSGLRIRLEHS